ncbi:hypothetical protein HZU75_03195 [Chitinibacter fontanus]|uniref:Uncharacterized protein n=1 Tax=Chitinibacter fontanus TaxID=1737446 RepID=A0A7D5V8C1_9NEIS|nr:hypothetical protein [Chitinibacter fontanus]QLI80615.1 hypothetical protein HZU75_03195 [Chitinibacter fontanus]
MYLPVWMETWWFALLCLGAFAAMWYLVYYNPGAQTYWERLPTRKQYLLKHPDCQRGEDIACCHCGSIVKLDLGLLQYWDWRRQMMCRNCKNLLWREQDQ